MQNASLDQRLDDLERQTLRLKRRINLLAAAAGLFAILAIAGWKQSGQIVQAKRFEVLDPSGKVVGAFGLLETGGAKMTLNNRNGTLIYTAGATDIGDGSIACFDGTGRRRFFVSPSSAHPEDYVLGIESGKSGPQKLPSSIQMGRFHDRGAGIKIFGASETSPRMSILTMPDESSEINMLHSVSGGTRWKAFDFHSELAFTNMAREGASDFRLDSTLVLNSPAGKLMQSDGSGPVYWPKPPER